MVIMDVLFECEEKYLYVGRVRLFVFFLERFMFEENEKWIVLDVRLIERVVE